MRLLFIRHGDPYYPTDSLTETGRIEAQLLADYIEKLEPGDIYVSPLGRARETASFSLKKLGKEEIIYEWMKEFPVRIDLEELTEVKYAFEEKYDPAEPYNRRHCPWDMLPSYYMSHPEYADRYGWRESYIAKHSDLVQEYDRVIKEFDRFLAGYGYVRDGELYRVEKSSHKTITFFCHFGITCVFLSRLWNVSPYLLWQSMVTAPSSVTEIVTEEREKGTAFFRTIRIGDTTHLNIAGQKPSFSARFCETYEDDMRH